MGIDIEGFADQLQQLTVYAEECGVEVKDLVAVLRTAADSLEAKDEAT